MWVARSQLDHNSEEAKTHMCDYSLHATPNRLAVDGEQLVAHRFPTGSMGLASPSELRPASVPKSNPDIASWWTKMTSWFQQQAPRPARCTAVCIPPGARLVLHDIPDNLRQELSVGETEDVVFVELSASAYRYRDGVRFKNGREILLQSLREGQRVDVMCLNPEERTLEAEVERLVRESR